MFVDEIKVNARAGHGGKGAVAFHRESFVPKGGPSGGNGGRGGDVILVADHDLNNLVNQFYQPRLHAENGHQGMGKGMDGLAGKDLIIKVPCGTLVWRLPPPPADPEGMIEPHPPVDPDDDHDAPPKPLDRPPITVGAARRPLIRIRGGVRAVEYDLAADDVNADDADNAADGRELVADLTTDGQRHVLCKAGRGGLGNRNFATSIRQTPRFAQPGEAGEEGDFLFELRIVADVGLVGYPNAGKSTLLTAISHARPKVAPYPFTTLTPQIGIVEYQDFHRVVVCDVPGLIEGAHRNVGLGHAFLRHIKRCKALVFLLDMAGTDGREPWDDYRSLISEIGLFDPELLTRPQLVVANKMDEPVAEANLKKFKRKVPKTTVLPISAAFDDGIERFKAEIRKRVEESTGA